jgi:hypothetical protein
MAKSTRSMSETSTMNLNLKAIFICVTSAHRWGKGNTIEEAKKNAGINGKISKGLQYYVQSAVLNDPTEQEQGEVRKCIIAHPIDGSPMYDLEGEDEVTKQIVLAKHVGWLMIEKNF